jgi:ATP-dependent Clp protease ATP-binding subunit ClpA
MESQMRRSFGRSPDFDKFTERARQVLSDAQEEAQRFNHTYIGTEHLLLGLLRMPDGIAARALNGLGVELDNARRAVEFIIGRGDREIWGEVGMTPRAKKAIELAMDEARRLNHHYVGTEHILLGIIREGEGIAAGVLTSLGATLEQVRVEVVRLLGAPSGDGPATPAASSGGGTSTVKSNVVTCRLDDAALSALDALVEAGVRTTRSDAAAWLIAAGIETHRALFDRVNATVSEIRRLRTEARSLVEQVSVEGQELELPEHPPEEDAPADGAERAE